MKRRALLAAVGTGAATVSGCLDSTDRDPPDLVLGRIEIANNSSEAVQLAVDVTRAGESVYEKTIALDPVEESGEYPSIDSELVAEGWMGDPVEYELSIVTVDEDLAASSSTTEAIERFETFGPDLNDGDCFAWYAEIGYYPTRELDAIRLGTQWIDTANDTLPRNCGQ